MQRFTVAVLGVLIHLAMGCGDGNSTSTTVPKQVCRGGGAALHSPTIGDGIPGVLPVNTSVPIYLQPIFSGECLPEDITATVTVAGAQLQLVSVDDDGNYYFGTFTAPEGAWVIHSTICYPDTCSDNYVVLSASSSLSAMSACHVAGGALHFFNKRSGVPGVLPVGIPIPVYYQPIYSGLCSGGSIAATISVNGTAISLSTEADGDYAGIFTVTTAGEQVVRTTTCVVGGDCMINTVVITFNNQQQ